MAKHTITNTSGGPRMVNTTTGAVMLKAGETRDDLELSDAELKSAKGTDWFAFGARAAKAAAAEPVNAGDLDALTKQVAALTKQVEDSNTAKAEAEKKLADAEKENAALTKQVEELTKPADKKS